MDDLIFGIIISFTLILSLQAALLHFRGNILHTLVMAVMCLLSCIHQSHVSYNTVKYSILNTSLSGVCLQLLCEIVTSDQEFEGSASLS